MNGTVEAENNMYMLYEAANQMPVYEVYQKLCKFRGNFDIDYVDFEQKYYRFYHGNSELESVERISSKTFSDLPEDILNYVIDDLELVDKLSLRKVSKKLRETVDNHKCKNSSVLIHFEADSSQIELAMNYITYSDGNGKSTYDIMTRSLDSDGDMKMKYKEKPRVIEGEHWELMIRDLSTFLCNPNWKFYGVLWDFDEGVDDDKLTPPDIRQKQIQLIENMLKTTPLQVYTLTIQSTDHTAVMAILPNVIPGSLEFLGLNSKNNGAKLEEVVELEQWKRLKRSFVQTVPDSFDIEHFFHLEQFKIVQIRITEDRLVKIRDILFKSPKFSNCTLLSKIEDRVNVDENGEEITPLRAFVILINRIMGEHPEYDAGTRCYSIPDSDEHFSVYSCQRGGDTLELEIQRQKNERDDFGDDSFNDSLREILGIHL
ncbi:hypothetical protein CAEBREN_02953 [Caenorhabditis brenneri]|uniref:F-box domain-containing protein n=1 Tax=Caenorhabditis brenneri TaxID=135651 RepID=G0PI61_CAEBE|nr:hypothetical protein CAEBREN_02953 [Caenorhabditis brenneri]